MPSSPCQAWRSVQARALRVTRPRAPWGASIRGSGTLRTSTRSGPAYTTARIALHELVGALVDPRRGGAQHLQLRGGEWELDDLDDPGASDPGGEAEVDVLYAVGPVRANARGQHLAA